MSIIIIVLMKISPKPNTINEASNLEVKYCWPIRLLASLEILFFLVLAKD